MENKIGQLERVIPNIPLCVAEDSLAFTLGVSRDFLARLRKSRTGPPYISLKTDNGGAVIRYSENDVRDWLRKNSSNVLDMEAA